MTRQRCRWAFLVADGSVFAWEQGMVVAERAGAATGADQSVLRFDHPTMADELAQMEALEGGPSKQHRSRQFTL